MKQRIFNGGNGWYISATNYKDKTDKAYMNVHFAVCEAPVYDPPKENPFTWVDIDIKEMKYTSWKQKIGLTIFKYDLIEEEKLEKDVVIEESELPFY